VATFTMVGLTEAQAAFTMVSLTEAQATASTPSAVTVEPNEDLDTRRSTPVAPPSLAV
jgi:hypothetical protein